MQRPRLIYGLILIPVGLGLGLGLTFGFQDESYQSQYCFTVSEPRLEAAKQLNADPSELEVYFSGCSDGEKRFARYSVIYQGRAYELKVLDNDLNVSIEE